MSKFQNGDVLTHRKGGLYTVLFTPEVCTLEKTREPAYAYYVTSQNRIHVRSQAEMEDGRFWLVTDLPVRAAHESPQSGHNSDKNHAQSVSRGDEDRINQTCIACGKPWMPGETVRVVSLEYGMPIGVVHVGCSDEKGPA